jgi:glucose/arabinose dehydrogenase
MLPVRLLPLLFTALATLAHGRLATEKVAEGFERPLWAGMPKDSEGKLWIMEQEGRVWIVDTKTGKRADQPFLDIRGEVSRKANEQGLLGLAFAPDFSKSGRFYVNFTDNHKHTQIKRFVSADKLTTDPASGELLLQFEQPWGNHNGGWISFGPDGMLYIGNGDGGSANDPKDSGQSMDTLLGKILRIDVSGQTGYKVPPDNPFLKKSGAKPEIWAYGVRNPWRCSFDRETGDFWMGDVGQNRLEEIHFIPRNKAAGANYGWRLREGDQATPAKGVGGDKPRGAIEPIYVYKHGNGPEQGVSVTGGYVYRGPIKSLQGRYVFADYQNPRIWSFVQNRGKMRDFKDHTSELQPQGGRINLISSFAEDNDGNLYIIDHTGPIYKIVER